MNDEKHDDDNPWDDDDGARTLATDGPSFELPSNIPSPITAPPPPVAMPARSAVKSTLVGLMPDDVRASLANRPAPRPVGAPRSQPHPVTIPDDALDDLPGQQDDDDGPTMMGAAASPNVPLRDDLAGARGFAPAHRINDADAETMALDFDDARLPNLDDEPMPDEVATRALTREQMMPGKVRQDAHVIVGSDARGDEATLAIGPDQLSPDLGELGASLDPALAEALAQRVAEHHQQVKQQAFQHQQQMQPPAPAPAPFFPQLHTQQQFAPQPHPQGPPPPFAQPAYPPSGPQPVAHPPSGQHPVMAPQSHAWGAPPSYANPPHSQQQPQSMTSPQPAPWQQAPAPLARPEEGGASLGGFRITSQVVVLAGVGVVCLAIFIVGLVLFFTTKF